METMTLHRQPHAYGCIYYSFASLMGLPRRWAERRELDCQYQRFIIRAWNIGYGLWPVYVDNSNATPAGPDLWRWIFEYYTEPGARADLHVSVPSISWRGVTHTVGMRLLVRADGVLEVHVFDTSGFDEVQTFSVEAFLESPYVGAYDIREIRSNQIGDWQPCWGTEAAHVLNPEACRL